MTNLIATVVKLVLLVNVVFPLVFVVAPFLVSTFWRGSLLTKMVLANIPHTVYFVLHAYFVKSATPQKPFMEQMNMLLQFWPVFILFLAMTLLVFRLLRFNNVNNIKYTYGFTDDPLTYQNMTVRQAQIIQSNLAEYEFPLLFEFGWISQFFTTATAPCLSRVIINSGHFTNKDPLIAHARQQDTVCLMTAIMALKLHTVYSGRAIARINEHHNRYGNQINSDTVLWLSEMWMSGPIRWINRVGWRKLQPFEEHAMFVFWRELSLLLGCKWVPNNLAEFKHFRQQYVQLEQKPAQTNVIFSDGIMDAILFMVPGFLKSFARKCVIAILDEDVRRCNKYTDEFSPLLRKVLLRILKTWGLFQCYCMPPRNSRRVLSPTEPNDLGLFNFPDYTYPATPYYVKQTFWNQWGLTALINRLRGKPIPSPRFGSNGVAWESMGAKFPDEIRQSQAEARVRQEAVNLTSNPWGYRAKVKFQSRPIAVDKHMGPGYGSRENAYTLDELTRKIHGPLDFEPVHYEVTLEHFQRSNPLLLADTSPVVVDGLGN
ncbi:hypothetical protein MMC28_008252 [Mycoblastus sanguinarius]|nr:hypothetical protein [Mycoblastus sanguinarius]